MRSQVNMKSLLCGSLMAGLAAIGDGGASDVPVGIELLKVPVAGADLLGEVEAPALALLHDEIVGQGIVVVDFQHQNRARRQRLACFCDVDGFLQSVRQLST